MATTSGRCRFTISTSRSNRRPPYVGERCASENVTIPKGLKVRRLHKAFLRYHDPHNWPLLRDALKRMGRADLIGNGKHQLVPRFQPKGFVAKAPAGRKHGGKQRPFRTQHVR